MKLKLADILPNPGRNLLKNPLKEDKLTELISSINETGFWNNVLVRINDEGKPEAAYGHHRIEAGIRAGVTEADFIVKKLSDEMMLKIMDRENSETYGTDLLAVMESIEAVVIALSQRKIKPFEHTEKVKDTLLRYAPSFIPGKMPSSADSADHAYTIMDIASFLGRVRDRGTRVDDVVTAAFAVLCNEELKLEGWTRKELLRKFKARKTIPVDAILDMAKAANANAERRLSIARDKAKQVEAQGKATQRQLEQLQEEARKAEKTQEKLEKDFLQAQEQGIKDKAKELRDRLDREAIEAREREARIAESKKNQKVLERESKKTQKEEQRLLSQQEAKEATAFLDRVKTYFEKIDRVFNDEDVLYDEGKRLRQDTRFTQAQRSALQLKLRDASARLANFNPFKTAPIRRKG